MSTRRVTASAVVVLMSTSTAFAGVAVPGPVAGAFGPAGLLLAALGYGAYRLMEQVVTDGPG